MEPRISIITLGVADLKRSYDFYTSLGLPTSKKPDSSIIFFKTNGVCLALFPFDKLAQDVSSDLKPVPSEFSGITLAHNTKERSEVDIIMQLAENAGGKVVKPAQEASWGGYSGYFSDPDGYLWEVAYSDGWEFNEDGSLVID